MEEKILEQEESLQEISNKIERQAISTKFLDNGDFHHFMQLLIDKEVGHKIKDFPKEYQNPFQRLSKLQR